MPRGLSRSDWGINTIVAKENPNSFATMPDFYEICGKTNIVAEKSEGLEGGPGGLGFGRRLHGIRDGWEQIKAGPGLYLVN